MAKRLRIVLDLVVEDDQYWAKVDMPYVVEQLSVNLKEVVMPNQGITVLRVEESPKGFIHRHTGDEGCNACFALGEDGQAFGVEQ